MRDPFVTTTGRRVALAIACAALAGCADHARLVDAERRIDVLQRHVVALEALLDDGSDDADDVGATQLVARR